MPAMNTDPSSIPEVIPESRLEEIHSSLKILDRRDWWLWAVAIIVTLLLTLAVFSLSFPGMFNAQDPYFQFSLNQSVRGLLGLVLLFNTYVVYQQVTIKRLRKQLSGQLEVISVLKVRGDEFHRLATVDPLTGLYNRRFAEQRLAAESARSERYGHPLTVISFDLNNFKLINDQHGHPVGDKVLREFADRLNKAVRVSDYAVRLGGDEFLAILPECHSEQVEALFRRLGKIEVDHNGICVPVTYAAGWAGYEQGESSDHLLERADRLLYANKRSSKEGTTQLSPVHST
jgi:diguanylate cyclase (GGDEF)-like protein